MNRDAFVDRFISVRKERNLTVEEAAAILDVSAKTLSMYESGVAVPTLGFAEKAEKFIGSFVEVTSFQNIFVQSDFGNKIPLLTEYDFINDCDYHVIHYYELPQLKKYEDKNLFALKYSGTDIPEKGILNDSILVFVQCDRIRCDGVYAVASRGALKFKQAEVLDTKEIRITPLDGKRRIPSRCKSASARGRLVCCINTYE